MTKDAAKKILIVEDDSKLLEALSNFFRRQGFDVSKAEDGMQGWEEYRLYKPDLMIIDNMMPKMNGLELLVRIIRENPSIPIIIITGYNRSDTEKKAFKLGAYDFFPKPFKFKDLLSSVKKGLYPTSADEKMSFDDFKRLLSDLFGQRLNKKAEVAALDFWQNVSAIADGVSQGNIAIHVDVLALARAFPEYKTYQVWKGLAILLFVASLPAFIFSWKIALGVLAASVLAHTIGNTRRRTSGQRFVANIQASIAAGDMVKGLGNLCAHYIAGNVQLASDLGRAHWPQFPSDVLTGQQNFIQ